MSAYKLNKKHMGESGPGNGGPSMDEEKSGAPLFWSIGTVVALGIVAVALHNNAEKTKVIIEGTIKEGDETLKLILDFIF